MMCLVKNFGWLTHLFIFFFNVITNTPEMTSGEKKNFPATCSHTQDNPHPTMAKVTMVTGFYLSGQKEH